MVKKTRKYKKGGSRTNTGRASRTNTARAYSFRPLDSRMKSVIEPMLFKKTVDELTPAEFNAVYRTITSKKGWDAKTSRQLGIDNTVLQKIKQKYAVHKIPKTFVSDITGEHTYKVLNHLHQIAPGPVLPLIEPNEGFSKYGIEENNDNIKVSDTTSYDITDDGTRQVTYDLENKLRIRSNVKTGVNAFHRSMTHLNQSSNISVDDIPIYFVVVVGAYRNIHLTIIVLYKNKLYSLGLGHSTIDKRIDTRYIEYHEGQMALYSPDYVLDLQNNFENRIVDIGILTPTHLAKISEIYMNKINELTIVIDDDDNVVNMLWNCDGCDTRYCTLSRTSSANRVNCTSFITNIFENIDCNFVLGIVSPHKCNTKPPIRREQIDDFFRAYSSGNAYDVIQVLQQ